jgi:hypothetical protein
MKDFHDFQAQVDLSGTFEVTQRRVRRSFKTNARTDHSRFKDFKPFLPRSVGFLNNDLKCEVQVRSFQQKVIPIQSVLPSLQLNRNAKSVKLTSSSRKNEPVMKRTFMKNISKSNCFYKFHNFFIRSIN